MTKNPIAIGAMTFVVAFLAGAVSSQLLRGDPNLSPSLVTAAAMGITFGAFTQWQNSKKSKSGSDDSQ